MRGKVAKALRKAVYGKDDYRKREYTNISRHKVMIVRGVPKPYIAIQVILTDLKDKNNPGKRRIYKKLKRMYYEKGNTTRRGLQHQGGNSERIMEQDKKRGEMVL